MITSAHTSARPQVLAPETGDPHSHGHRLQAKVDLDAIVHDNHNGATHTTEALRDETLVHAHGTLVLENLEEAVNGALVETLGSGLLGLEHHAATHGIEVVVERHDGGTGGGGGKVLK